MTEEGIIRLQKSIVYGPVLSKRLGRSLGINLMPLKYKVCSFNCIYCHYGNTKVSTCRLIVEDGKFFTESKTDQVEIYTPLEIVRELEKALEKKPEIDYVTFSGNGEPTLHPQFLEICSELRELRNRYMPNLPIALLSNSTCLHRTDVLEAINFIDLPILKLDCGNQKIFQIINRPVEGISFGLIVEALSKIESPVLQSVFVDGKFSNATKEAVREWIDVIEKIKPHAIQIYSIDRPLPHSGLVPVKVERLNEIASLVKSRVSCRAEVFIE